MNERHVFSARVRWYDPIAGRFLSKHPLVRLVDHQQVLGEFGKLVQLVVAPAEVNGSFEVLQAHELDAARRRSRFPAAVRSFPSSASATV